MQENPPTIGLIYDSKNPDHIGNKNAWFRDQFDNPLYPQKQHRELVVEAPDLSKQWEAMVYSAEKKDNIYPYDFLDQNSNSLADVLLREAGFPQPKKDGFTNYLAPGSLSIYIASGINCLPFQSFFNAKKQQQFFFIKIRKNRYAY